MFNLTKLELLWEKMLGVEKKISDNTAYTPPAYSTEEINTGQKWIDGRDIYKIVLTGKLPEIESGSSTTPIASFSGKEVISFTGYAVGASGSRVPFNSNFSGATIAVYQGITGSIGINANTSFSEATYNLIVFYVKTPEPGNLDKETKKKTTKKEETK